MNVSQRNGSVGLEADDEEGGGVGVMMVVHSVIASVGVVGNLNVVVVFLNHVKLRRKVPNIFIVNQVRCLLLTFAHAHTHTHTHTKTKHSSNVRGSVKQNRKKNNNNTSRIFSISGGKKSQSEDGTMANDRFRSEVPDGGQMRDNPRLDLVCDLFNRKLHVACHAVTCVNFL